MASEGLTECIRTAVQHTQFRNVFGQCFDSPVMRGFYAKKMKREYSVPKTEAIRVSETALAALVNELLPRLEPYRSPEDGAVCNGLYHLMGSLASPRLPSVEDYARMLVVAAARIGPQRVTNLITGWLEGVPVRASLCALLKGVRTDGPLHPLEGLRLETLPGNGEEFPRSLYVQIDEHDIRHEQYSHRAILYLDHDRGPALYLPSQERDMQVPLRAKIRHQELSSVSVGSICRSISIEANSYIDWFMQWWDYGDVDAFFLNAGFSSVRRDTRNPSPQLISEEQLVNCLELHGLLEKYTDLDRGIARWIRSKRPVAREEQLVELRIALESVLLSNDRGGAKKYRLARRGAWLLSETFEMRKEHFQTLRDAYGLASEVVHGGTLEGKDPEHVTKVMSGAQDLCRDAILQIVSDGATPDWSDLVMGKGFRREP